MGNKLNIPYIYNKKKLIIPDNLLMNIESDIENNNIDKWIFYNSDYTSIIFNLYIINNLDNLDLNTIRLFQSFNIDINDLIYLEVSESKINNNNNYIYPLIYCIKNQLWNSAQVLLDAGANPFIYDESGNNPLEWSMVINFIYQKNMPIAQFKAIKFIRNLIKNGLTFDLKKINYINQGNKLFNYYKNSNILNLNYPIESIDKLKYIQDNNKNEDIYQNTKL